MLKKIPYSIYFLTIILSLTGCSNEKDTTPPVISIVGDNPVDLILGVAYTDEGASAVDDVDGPLNVVSTGSADISTVGTYQITYTATDNAGNQTTEIRIINVSAPVDITGPELISKDPVDNAIITDIKQSLIFSLNDIGVGVNAESIEVKINGVGRSSLATFQSDEITIIPDESNYWQSGVLLISIKAADNNANTTEKDFTYTVQPATAALPRAFPSTGFAPLSVSFTPFNTTSTAISLFEWDFDNDDNFDVSETVGRNQTRTFSVPGTYPVTLKVTDAEGNVTEGTVDVIVQNKPPEVSATASPSNGSSPLTVMFSSNAQDVEGVALYEWDFEGDGTFDLTDATASTATHTYSTEGKFQPVLKVKDSLGAETIYSFDDIEVQVNPQNYPTVELSSSPQTGDAPLASNLTATTSAVGIRTITKWEWDFDGDGTYDETTTVDNVSHTYTSAGNFYTRVRVTDSDNQSSEDVIKVTVRLNGSLSRSVDTIDTALNEKVTITTVLSADITGSIVIENSLGVPVRTLVPTTARLAGTYTDDWDGRDDAGNLVAEGEYRVILLYDVNGEQQRVDLAESSGGGSYNPTRTSIPSSFQPFAGNPLVIDFTLDKASEVTAFMGRYNVNTRLLTFMQRKPLGKGTHRITWNGEDSTGQLIHPPAGDSFLFGIFGYYMPDNGVYVRSGANISEVVASPTIFVPDSVNDPLSKLQFDLSNPASVRLTVYDAESGTLVLSRTDSGLAAGANEITWDGKNNQGVYVAPGKYRLGITAIDSNGYQSITQYVVQQVYY